MKTMNNALEILSSALLATVFLALTACGGSSGGGGNGSSTTVATTYGLSGCSNCTGYTLLSPMNSQYSSSQYGSMQLSMNFLGSTGLPMPAYFDSYQGPLAITGTFYVMSPVQVGNYCLVPAGTYTINTNQAGSMSQSAFSMPQGTLQAVNQNGSGSTFDFEIVNGGADVSTQRAFGQMYILDLNGNLCGNDPGFYLN